MSEKKGPESQNGNAPKQEDSGEGMIMTVVAMHNSNTEINCSYFHYRCQIEL